MSHPLWYTITSKMIKNKKQNMVKTTTKMNLAAAVLNDTLRNAEVDRKSVV